MPRGRLQDPWGTTYQIDTSSQELLRAWFDDVLPLVNASYGQDDIPPARIMVHPFWLPAGDDMGGLPDWFADSRVIGRMHDFPGRTGADAMAALEQLHRQLTEELERLNGRR